MLRVRDGSRPACRYGSSCWRPACHFKHPRNLDRRARLEYIAAWWKDELTRDDEEREAETREDDLEATIPYLNDGTENKRARIEADEQDKHANPDSEAGHQGQTEEAEADRRIHRRQLERGPVGCRIAGRGGQGNHRTGAELGCHLLAGGYRDGREAN